MQGPGGKDVLPIGSRLELFVDEYVIEALQGGARRQLHAPQPREIVLVHDRPWEGNVCAYHTFIRDGDRVRVYYRGAQLNERIAGPKTRHEVTCLAESDDGIVWRKPALGLVPFQGSAANNVILSGPGTHNFAPFLDSSPAAPLQQRYKALGSARRPQHGLLPFASADGVHWSLLSETPVITDGKFDSQNIAFWDSERGEYRAYYRDFQDGVRGIKTATSPDFLHWTAGEWLKFPGAGTHQLYTNQVLPYYRAPHIYLGFPTRFLPDRGQITEGLLMASRDGVTFSLWEEALLRPGPNRDRWGNRSNYIWYGLIETAGSFPGSPNELSIYSTEHYYEGSASYVRRFTFRIDGFVSVQAPYAGGGLLTRILSFTGERLVINAATSAAGSVAVELLTPDGDPLPGFALDDCDPFWGDAIEHTVTWKGSADVSALQGRPLRLRFFLRDADLYSFRFAPAP